MDLEICKSSLFVNPPQVTPVSVETVHRPSTTTPYPQVQLSLESSHTQATSDCKESNLIQARSSSSFQKISLDCMGQASGIQLWNLDSLVLGGTCIEKFETDP
ncbi:unnamed protein product [Porites evermanni]|uniref:Uncharacterized protein n=1 Tax=Porites evermanni TaxID=104178 RepID=A0ABN8M6U9_9CNID|nr:unnamed protein product [Porites evermanni]CAH3028558.1 unnamed protein product [Porites evermanni]